MSEDAKSADDRTEEATQERRDEFREKGNVVSSRELTSVVVLAGALAFFTFYGPVFLNRLADLYISHFERIRDFRITPQNAPTFAREAIMQTMILIIPLFVVSAAIATAITFLQTRFNVSWKRLQPDFSRINPLKGIVRLVGWHPIVELLKGIAKLGAIGTVSYLILKSQWVKTPALLMLNFKKSWEYWLDITKDLFWGVSMLMVAIAGLDYAYNFFSMERKLKMTKQEVKEEYKKREVDPHVKARIRRMQREFSAKKVLDKTKGASVLVTNPEHFAIALKYELGMSAPVVVAKGIDFLALRMREVAKEMEIPIVENKALARTLYKMVDEDQEIPESLYKAVSEVIRYVFKLRGINVNKKQNTENSANV